MISKIEKTTFKTDNNFSIITPECIKYNECRAIIITTLNCFDNCEINFVNKDNLSVFSWVMLDKSKLEKVMDYCFGCINYNRVISAQHIIKIAP